MTTFLSKIAKYLIDHHQTELSQLCVVMPNRRAGLFLNRLIAEELKVPVWAPQFYPIEEFMQTLSGLNEVDPIHVLTELYTVYKEVEGEKARPFDEYLNWGPQLIADFNEVDRNMVNGEELFGYLTEAKAIHLWNLDKTPLTDFQKNYLAFYQSLGKYHALLVKRLVARGEGYQGLLFKRAAERVETGEATLPWKRVLFAGFNALTTAEVRIMKAFASMGIAQFLWDADTYYVDQPQQEAGRFLRQWLSTFSGKEKTWLSSDFLNGEKEIMVMGVPDTVGQVKYCAEILSKGNIPLGEKTAIVLPDENLLIPLLNSLPAEVKDVNITMGLLLNTTPLNGLLESLFHMHLHTDAMRGSSEKMESYYHQDLLNILQHPLSNRVLTRLTGDDLLAFHEKVERIRSGGKIFIALHDLPLEGLRQKAAHFIQSIFKPWHNPSDAITGMKNLLQWIRDTLTTYENKEKGAVAGDNNQAELEYAYAFTKIIHQLDEVMTHHPDYFSLPILFQFFRQLTASATIPFYGEPLKGMQVMGMLETRALDFENLIILSCNEGILPATKTAHSFIPFDIRSEFGLPTYQQKEAVFAYHFYRLLQRAKNVWLLYNSEPDTLGGGEQSRYLSQIIQELPRYNPGINIHEHLLASKVMIAGNRAEIVLNKSDDVMDRLLKRCKDGLAPTALNAFRACALRFYFSEIAGIREPDDPHERIDPKSMGTAIHSALFNLYQPHLDRVVSDQDFKEMTQIADQITHRAFTERFPESSLTFGKNLLLLHVARFMIKNYLRSEQEFAKECTSTGDPYRIIMLEKLITRTIYAESRGERCEVVIKGFVDRIDQVGNAFRIIDYKTGTAQPRELKVLDWPSLVHDPILDKAFQLLVYAWLSEDTWRGFPIEAGIISLRNISAGLLKVSIPDGDVQSPMDGRSTARKFKVKESLINRDDVKLFENQLVDLVAELLDVEQPFSQTNEISRCKYCVYRSICGR